MLGGPSRLNGDQLDAERVRELARDLVLQREQIARVAVEPFGPEMHVGLGIDQLGVDTDLVPRSADAAFNYIAHRQFVAYLLRINPLALIGERGIARNYEHPCDPRQIGRQILGYSIGEILLLPIVAEVREG